jgi:hypothetical protein
MKKHNFGMPDEAFFEAQASTILEKTSGLENWKLNGIREPEETFPVSDSFWLKMEDGIRSRIKPKQTRVFQLYWKPIFASMLMALTIGLGTYNFLSRTSESEIAEQKLEQLNQEEILNYLTENEENRKITELLAASSFHETSVELPMGADHEIEEFINESNLYEYDLEPNL